MIKTLVAAISLALLAACQSSPKLKDDTRYVKLATVVDIHEFSEVERKQAQANRPSNTRVGMGFGIGVGSGGSFGGLSLGVGGPVGDSRDQPPLIDEGANRITVQMRGSTERTEVMSYGHHKMGDCVKVLAEHPSEFPRFFELKPGERCE